MYYAHVVHKRMKCSLIPGLREKEPRYKARLNVQMWDTVFYVRLNVQMWDTVFYVRLNVQMCITKLFVPRLSYILEHGV